MGFWEDLGKTICSTALAVSYFTPIGPVTGILTVSTLAVSGTVEIIGHITDDENAKKVGGIVRGVAFSAAIDGISGGALEGVRMSKATAEGIKLGSKAVNRALERQSRIEGTYLPTPEPKQILFVAKNIF